MSVLTIKQKLWAEHYIQTRNGTKAARLAGYKGSDNVLAQVGHGNIRNPKIQKYLSERYSEIAMDSDEVLKLLADLARSGAADFVNEHGIIDWEKIKSSGYSIKSIKHNKGKSSRIEVEPRLKALELIGRSHGLFIDKIAPTDPTGQHEYGADARNTLISRLIPELAGRGEAGETAEPD